LIPVKNFTIAVRFSFIGTGLALGTFIQGKWLEAIFCSPSPTHSSSPDSIRNLTILVSSKIPGDKVKIQYQRDDTQLSVEVILGDRPKE
jgi:hypothetical protein